MAKKKLELEEIIRVFTDFLNESGNYYSFKDFIEKQGYTLEEFGMEE